MKRMMIATALVTTLGTAAFAATDTQIQQIEAFGANIDTSAMTDEQLDQAYSIITSSESRSDQVNKLRSLVNSSNLNTPEMLSEGEMARLRQYAPDADFTNVTRGQAQSALSLTYGSESEGEKATRVQSILADEAMVTTMEADISASQKLMIESYVGDVDISNLSEAQLDAIIQAIHAGMSRGETVGQIESIING